MITSSQPSHTDKQGMGTFIVIWAGQLISILGSGLTSFALGVYIFSETGQVTPFTIAILLGTLPRLVLTPIAGSLADRWNRRWLMILSDVGAALVTLFALLMLTAGELQVWHIYLINLFNAVFASFQEPAYLSSITMLVPKKQLGRASGMVSLAESSSIILAPILAGFLFGAIGLHGIILIDFATFFFALGALLIVRIPQPQAAESSSRQQTILHDIGFGWRYLRTRPGLFGLVWYFAMLNFIINLSGVLITPLVLSFASVDRLGIVQAVSGIGMLVGSIVMSAWGGPSRKIWGIFGFIALIAFGLIIAGLQENLWFITVGMFIIMIGGPLASGCSQALFQSKVEPAIQGRVFAIRSTIARSMIPLALLSVGPLADQVFNPLLVSGGQLADTLIGQWVGIGANRGIGLMLVLAGFGMWVATLSAILNPHMRRVDTDLPDARVELSGLRCGQRY